MIWRWFDQAVRIARVMETVNDATRHLVPVVDDELVAEISGAGEMARMRVVLDVDPSDDTLLVYTPYTEAFIEDLKETIPSGSRWWDKPRRCWHVDFDWTGNVQILLEEHFGDLSHHYSMRAIDAIDELTWRQREEVLAREARCRKREASFRPKRRKPEADAAPEADASSPPPEADAASQGKHSRPAKKIDAYRVLGVTEDAPRKVVEAAYKAQATLHHPDTPDGSTEAMSRINAAYEEIKRRRSWS